MLACRVRKGCLPGEKQGVNVCEVMGVASRISLGQRLACEPLRGGRYPFKMGKRAKEERPLRSANSISSGVDYALFSIRYWWFCTIWSLAWTHPLLITNTLLTHPHQATSPQPLLLVLSFYTHCITSPDQMYYRTCRHELYNQISSVGKMNAAAALGRSLPPPSRSHSLPSPRHTTTST